jgi:GT2 family glycosyltransferase
MREPIIIIPYIHESEIASLRTKLIYLPVFFWEDTGRIGSDLAYQTLWNMFPDRDVIILHSDMAAMPEDADNKWYYELLETVNKYPEAGIFGTTLLYPAKDDSNNYYIQHAGGQFLNGEAIHYGGGLNLYNSTASRPLESDTGQYSNVREVPWCTFGGVYIRRSVINDCGPFDPSYYWTYYRDVDYCLTARSRGWKIYQTPIRLLHFEGRDNKRLIDNKRLEQQTINHQIFFKKWANSSLLENINRVVDNEKSTPKHKDKAKKK